MSTASAVNPSLLRPAPVRTANRRLLWGGYGIGSLVLGIAYFAFPNEDAQSAIYQLFGLGALSAIVVGVRLYRPQPGRHWWLFVAAFALWVTGDAYWDVYRWVLHAQAPYPSPADVAYAAGYPAFIAGVLVLSRGWGRPRLGDVLDGAIVAFPAALLALLVLVQPSFGAGLSLSGTTLAVSTPVADFVLLMALAQIAVRRRSSNFALRVIVGGTIALLVADAIYGYLNLTGSYESGMAVDALWMVGYACWGVAALHPSMASIRRLPERKGRGLSPARIILLVAALLTAPAGLLLDGATSRMEAIDIGIIGVITTLLVCARGALIQRESTAAKRALGVSEQRFRELFEEAEQARVALARQNDQLVELDHLKDDLVALVSHELRTPLTSIVGYLELVLDGDDPVTDEQRKFLGVVDRNADRLLSLVSDLLFVAQVQAGRLSIEREPLRLGELVREAVAAATPTASTRGVTLTLTGLEDADVVGDKQRLAQVVDNLLSNALKFTPSGGSVEVRLTADARDVVVEVVDDGMGISRADQAELFTRFFRTESAMKQAIQGTGLGLSIVKAIVEAHGGEISVESDEGRGATFRVVLVRATEATPVEVAA